MKKLQPDIVHSHYVNDWSFIGAANHDGPLVTTAWGSDILNTNLVAKVSKVFKIFDMFKNPQKTTFPDSQLFFKPSPPKTFFPEPL